MAAASIPEWKQSLLKQRQAKEESLKESSTDDKYAGLPAWKRDLLLKKEEEQRKAQQESERPKLIFGGPRPSSSTTDVKLKLATDAQTKEDASPRKATQPRTPVKAGGSSQAPGSPGPASTSLEATAAVLVRSRIAAMTVADGSPPPRSSFSRTPSGTPLAAPTSPGFLPSEETSMVRSIVRQLVAENKSESQLREKQLRRRSDVPLAVAAPAPPSPLPRVVSEPALSLSKSPRGSILQSPGKRKPMTRKLSWSDAAAAPLAVVGPTAYYSDSESEDVPPPSATITEDEEEATGLALRVHKSLAERMAKSKVSKSPTSPPAHSPSSRDEEDQGPLILDENEASMIF